MRGQLSTFRPPGKPWRVLVWHTLFDGSEDGSDDWQTCSSWSSDSSDSNYSSSVSSVTSSEGFQSSLSSSIANCRGIGKTRVRRRRVGHRRISTFSKWRRPLYKPRTRLGDWTLRTASKQKLAYENNEPFCGACENGVNGEGRESCSSEASTYLDDAATAGSTNFNFTIRWRAAKQYQSLLRYSTAQRLTLPQNYCSSKMRIPAEVPAPFQYRPLQDNEIRLLELLPGREYEMVHTKIHHVQINSDVAYEAVSYAWGTGSRDHLILVDGHSFQISQTLEAALVQFRRDFARTKPSELREYHDLERVVRSREPSSRYWPAQCIDPLITGRSRYLWVDAICINQNDTQERNHQVKKMSNVYSQAKLLRIWLGRTERRSGMAMDILINHAYAVRQGDEGLRQWSQILPGMDNIASLYALGSFFNRPWFRRAWVLQEYALCSTIEPEIYCGRRRLPWGVLALFINRGIHRKMTSAFTNTTPIQFHKCVFAFDMAPDFASQAEQSYRYPKCSDRLKDILAGQFFMTFSRLLRLESTRIGCRHSCHNSLLDLLDVISCLRCTDPKDKLYSILGLLQHSSSDLLPLDFDFSELIIDYSATTEDVLSSIVRAVITRTKSLEVLRFCNLGRGVSTRTWTLDWQDTPSGYIQEFPAAPRLSLPMIRRPPDACQSTLAEFSFCGGLSTLSVKGIRWDRINRVFAPPKLKSKTMHYYEYYKAILQVMFQHARCYWDPTVTSLFRERLSSCMGLFPDMSDGELAGSWDVLLEEWTKIWEQPCTHQKSKFQIDDEAFRKLVIRSITDKDKFSMTDMGYICRTRNEVKEGDFACILLGCRVPMLLRQVDDHYELVGEVFCHGIMFGEAFGEAVGDLERGDRGLQNFVLH